MFLCFYDHLAPESLEHVALRIGPSDRWGLSEASMAVGRNGTPYYGRGGAGVGVLCLKSLRMYNLKVCVREISGMYRLYVCVWHPISRTCCVKNRPQRPLGIERSVNGRWQEWNADSRESLVRGARG